MTYWRLVSSTLYPKLHVGLANSVREAGFDDGVVRLQLRGEVVEFDRSVGCSKVENHLRKGKICFHTPKFLDTELFSHEIEMII